MEVYAVDDLFKEGKISAYERDTFYLFCTSDNGVNYLLNSIDSELMTPYDPTNAMLVARVLARQSVWVDIKIVIQKIKNILEGKKL